MRSFLDEMKKRVLIYDGSKGTVLQKMGLDGGECPELWNETHQEKVRQVYQSYKDAGCDIIQTNTFQGNRIKLNEYGLGEKTYELNYLGAKIAKEVMQNDGFVAASIGPIGKLMEPSGDLSFEMAYEVYKEQSIAVADGGADIINFETFTDLAEMRAALLAAKDNTKLPIICSMAFENNGRTLMGSDPILVAEVLKALGADVIGTNCSFGPEHMVDITQKLSEVSDILISAKPNAGLPKLINGNTIYDETPERFAQLSSKIVKQGIRLIGGCCGTTPEYISAVKVILNESTCNSVSCVKSITTFGNLDMKNKKLITSLTKHVNIQNIAKDSIGNFIMDDESLSELINGNEDGVINTALDTSCAGFDAVYFNLDKILEANSGMLPQIVNIAQGYIQEPFIIKTSYPDALENTLRLYRGIAGVIVTVNEKKTEQELVEICKKYGATVLDLLL